MPSMPQKMLVTVILLRVRVPVLSRQMVCMDPRVSMAFNCLTKTWCLLMERMPRARLVVATAGNPSGTAATAREIEVLSMRRKPYPRSNPTTKTTPHTPALMRASLAPIFSS